MNSVCIRRPAEFPIFEAALDGVVPTAAAFQNLLAVLLVERFQQFDRVVGSEFTDAFGDLLRLQFLEDLLADGLVDFVERGEVKSEPVSSTS